MSDLAVKFEDAEEVTFYKILAALVSMKGGGYIKKVKFEERKIKYYGGFMYHWFGEVQFFSREAMEIFGKKLKRRPRSSSV